MRTFGMWLLAGLFMLAGWDAFERIDEREAGAASSASQDAEARATEDGTPPPPSISNAVGRD